MISVRELHYHPSTEYDNHKISEFLRNQGYSKQLLTSLRHCEGSIILNGNPVHMNHLIPSYSEGSTAIQSELTVRIPELESASEIIPMDLPIEILYEDEDLFVINKPANMPIQPSRSNPDNSLANALAYLYQTRGDHFVYRCVNRLDRDTTGLTIIAKNALSAGILYEMVKTRTVERTYYAIVSDEIVSNKIISNKIISNEFVSREAPHPYPCGTISLPISRSEATDLLHSIRRFVDRENGASAITHYKVISHNPQNHCALVELRLDTGRTHQIRVHMEAIGSPLLGDPIYNPTDQSASRHLLHAGKLTFPHPITKEQLSFSSELPADMRDLIDFTL